VCHNDTSQWNPKHISFQILKVQPGTVPICHIIVTQDHVVWVSKDSMSNMGHFQYTISGLDDDDVWISK
jgi:hypothetical protein